MAFSSEGTLTTDEREVAESETWDTQTEWDAAQSKNNVVVESGVVKLAEISLPDEGNLYAQYDAQSLSLSDQDTVTSWPDESGNGYDMSGNGDPTYHSDGLNGNASVDMTPSSSDYFVADTWDALSQPFTAYAVFTDDAGDDGTVRRLWTNDGTGDRSIFFKSGSTPLYRMYSGSTLSGSNGPTTQHSSVHDGASSLLRENGTETVSGDAGTQGLGSFRVGSQADGTRFWNGYVCEILIYNTAHGTSTLEDVEAYLSDRWGVTV